VIRTASGALAIAVRSAALPVLFGARWLSQREQPDEVPSSAVGLGLAAKVVADELFLASEILSGALISGDDRLRVMRELEQAAELYQERGWLDDPARYHNEPPAIERAAISHERTWGLSYQHLRFTSGWAPHVREPGRQRWLGYQANRTAHVRLLCHSGGPRPWIVCAPGFRMGNPTIDFAGFNARWLHRQLGLNVAIPVLPFHGPRRVGRRGGDGFLTGDLLDTIHAQAQAIRDIRSLIAWVRDRHRAPRVAAYGLSLGGYTAALLASIESNLDAVIVGIPATDFVSLLREHMPERLGNLLERHGFPFQDLQLMMRVVSPLAMAPRLPVERRTLYAARADGLAVPSQALALGEHWDQPEIKWLAGTHVSAIWDREVEKVISDALCRAGLTERSHGKDAAAYAVGLSPGLLSAPA
jgi:hypothetical protein